MAFVASCGIADYQQDREISRCGRRVAPCGISPPYRGLLWHECGILYSDTREVNIHLSEYQLVIDIATDATRVICGIIDFC